MERVCRGVAAKARGGEPDPFSVAMGAWLGDAVAQQEGLVERAILRVDPDVFAELVLVVRVPADQCNGARGKRLQPT